MKPKMTKEEVLQAIRECAEKLGRVPSFTQAAKMTQLTIAVIRTNFGTYKRALAAGGLERAGSGYEATLRELFEDWAGLARKMGRPPTIMEYQKGSAYSVRPLTRRFKSWMRVPEGLMEFCKGEGLQREYE